MALGFVKAVILFHMQFTRGVHRLSIAEMAPSLVGHRSVQPMLRWPRRARDTLKRARPNVAQLCVLSYFSAPCFNMFSNTYLLFSVMATKLIVFNVGKLHTIVWKITNDISE
jgi:hypothetical protein